MTFVRVALCAGVNAGLATYAPRGVNEEVHVHLCYRQLTEV